MNNDINSRLILITGGQRSGKSRFAEKITLELDPVSPVYIATAEIHDDDFAQRVRTHQERRGPMWTNIEESERPGEIAPEGRTVLLECVTLWTTKLFFKFEMDIEKAENEVMRQVELMISRPGNYIFVTNEIGLGGTSSNIVQRKFTDLLGSVNRRIAQLADTVYMTVAGIPVCIKNNENNNGTF